MLAEKFFLVLETLRSHASDENQAASQEVNLGGLLHQWQVRMFNTILHANDGSELAFKALRLALIMTKQNAATFHLVCVEEIPLMPESIEEIREARSIAASRSRPIVERVRELALESGIEMKKHIKSGHPVWMIVELADEISADLLVIGATGHSAFYERMLGSRADRIVQLARCPVLVVK